MKPTALPFLRRSLATLALALASSAPLLALEPRPPVDGNGIFTLNSGKSPYYGYAPDTYNPAVPISLFVWMHGCGGNAYWDVLAVSPMATRANQSFIVISIGGRDGQCWNTSADAPKVLAAIDHVSRYFNINPRKVHMGGYSSGGDMTYRVGFENAGRFAGLLAVNSDPFRDTGKSGQALMAAASWKINVAHLAHTEDGVYPIAGVRANLATLQSKGFPVYKLEQPGGHWVNDPNGTNHNMRTYLLPYLNKGWLSPLPTITTGKKKITTPRPSIVLRGKSKNASIVEYKVPGARYKKAKGKPANWKVTVRLTRPKTVVQLRAKQGSLKSKVLKVTIRRSIPRGNGAR